ncbi:hypothetical protein HanXRQr2_Chr05g0234261 [Helianthus annuus]|uniref:Uncharacterized protein n=1 Tax=Helianthus annuus TaxID=4232 RepID=A0A9K3NNQ7_HELAN|nr:hypothetical protein HanXRQr2_Chr05g0234261 [Helianthus annuus]
MFNQSPGGFTCPITSPTVSILNNPSKTGLRDKMPCATVAIQDENDTLSRSSSEKSTGNHPDVGTPFTR